MTNRERFLSVLKGEKIDRLPWFADLSYYYFSLQQDNLLEEKYEGDEGYLRFHIDKEVGIYLYAPYMWDISYKGGVKYSEYTKGNEKLIKYETPYGCLESVQKYLPSTYSWAYTNHFVNDYEQLKIMLYVHENTLYHENYGDFDKIDKLWGGHGVPTAIPPISVSPLQKLLARWAGVETTVNLFAEDTDAFEKILCDMQETEDKPFEIICNSKADYIEYAENLSSEITGRMFFDMFNKDYYTKRNKQLHDAGKFVGIHIDGTLRPCLSQLAECGFDVAEAVTPAPVGDIEIEDLRSQAGDITIIGGMPGAMFTKEYSDDFFNAHLERLIETFIDDGKFMVGVADQIPPDVVPERIERVGRILKNI